MIEKETLLEYPDGCKIEIDSDGNIFLSECKNIVLGPKEIEMLNKIKDIILE